ncbi:hypothetical protein Bca4012_014495 [Brassica carinata]
MESKGPSPVVPLVLVVVFGWILCGSYLILLLEDYILPILQTGTFIVGILLLLLLLLLHVFSSSWISPWIPSLLIIPSPASATSTDSESFGLGSFLLLSLFFIFFWFFQSF